MRARDFRFSIPGSRPNPNEVRDPLHGRRLPDFPPRRKAKLETRSAALSRVSRALLDQEMGLGEYEYIYVLAYYAWPPMMN